MFHYWVINQIKTAYVRLSATSWNQDMQDRYDVEQDNLRTSNSMKNMVIIQEDGWELPIRSDPELYHGLQTQVGSSHAGLKQ